MMLQRRRITPVCAKVQLNPHLFTPHIAKNQATHAKLYKATLHTHTYILYMLLSKMPLQWAIVFHILPTQFFSYMFLHWAWNDFNMCSIWAAQPKNYLVWIALDFASYILLDFASYILLDFASYILLEHSLHCGSGVIRERSPSGGRGALDGIKGRRLDAIQSDTACSFVRNMHMALIRKICTLHNCAATKLQNYELISDEGLFQSCKDHCCSRRPIYSWHVFTKGGQRKGSRRGGS